MKQVRKTGDALRSLGDTLSVSAFIFSAALTEAAGKPQNNAKTSKAKQSRRLSMCQLPILRPKAAKAERSGGWEFVSRNKTTAGAFGREAWTSRIMLAHDLPLPPSLKGTGRQRYDGNAIQTPAKPTLYAISFLSLKTNLLSDRLHMTNRLLKGYDTLKAETPAFAKEAKGKRRGGQWICEACR